MRILTAHEAGTYTARLDRIASVIETDWEALGLTKKEAMDFAFEVDAISDTIETTSKQAKLLEGNPAGVFDSFADVPGYIEGRQANPDETYMKTFTYKPNGVHPTAGSGTSVSERTEAPIEGLNMYSDGFKKQPSQPYIGGSPFPSGRTSSLIRKGRYVKQTK